MGCVGGKEQNASAGAKVGSKIANGPESKTAAAPLPQKKLTLEEINKKREEMKLHLQEGNAQPPNVSAPHIGNVTAFELKQ